MTHRYTLSDTAPDASSVQLDLYRRMTAAEKVGCVRDLGLSANAFALAGLRQRHPDAGERELLLRLAVLRLGSQHVLDAYGWRPLDDA